jgi:serine/threonine protein kinase
MNVHVTALLNKEPDYSMLPDPNLIDLFNHIFIKDPSSRITIRDIK